MNEDERGITPANVTAITIERRVMPEFGDLGELSGNSDWLVTIEQGNGDVIKTIQLTEMERMQLAALLEMASTGTVHLDFIDIHRAAAGAAP